MKIKNTGETQTISGTEFPKGKVVEVTSAYLIGKVLAREGFEEVKDRAKNKD